MFKRVDHIALHVPDVEEAATFYESVLGFTRYFGHSSSRGEPILYLRLGEMVLELTQHTPAEPMSGFHFCLETEDIDTACSRLTEAGVPLIQAPRPTTPRAPAEAGWHRAVFRGPNGEMIELRGRPQR